MPAVVQIASGEDFDKLQISTDDDYPEIKAAYIQLSQADNNGPCVCETDKGKRVQPSVDELPGFPRSRPWVDMFGRRSIHPNAEKMGAEVCRSLEGKPG